MKKLTIKAGIFAACAALLFSSCIGTFKLTHKVLDWNNNFGGKFANEVIFLACNIIPVYPVAMFIDALILNTVEFWTGSNPMASTGTLNIESNDKYDVTKTAEGYKLVDKVTNVTMDLVFDASTKTWSAVAEGQSFKLVSFDEQNNMVAYAHDGSTKVFAIN